jgi:adenylate kinase
VEFLVLLGPPGAGKGTISRLLHQASGFQPLSTGEVIRKEMADPLSTFGQQSRPFMDRGDYIPDDLAISLFFFLLTAYPPGTRLCLDGFPRTIPQAEAFVRWVNEKGHRFLGYVFLELPVEDALRRLGLRRVCSQCRTPYHLTDRPPQREGLCDTCGGRLIPREDDDAILLARRQERHLSQTRPLLDWFRPRVRGLEADGRNDPEDVMEEIRKTFSLL